MSDATAQPGSETDETSDLSRLKQCPAATRQKLEKLGLHRLFDLVLHLPLRYEDETHVAAIAGAPIGAHVQVEAVVLKARVQYAPRKSLIVHVGDASGELTLRFLNFYPSQVKQLQEGARLRLFGEIRGGFNGPEMVHPRYRLVTEETPLPDRLTPIYPTTAGVGQDTMRRLVADAVEQTDLSEYLPPELLAPLKLPSLARSLHYLHHPPPEAALRALDDKSHPAWRRLIFDELLAQQLSMRLHYNRRRAKGAPVLADQGELRARLLAGLPFQLTGAQQRVAAEIRDDLARAYPTQRLVQGDVGSGKTLVAVLACLQAVENGYQAAFLAPTDILAEQHAMKIFGWLEPLGVRVVRLSASMPKREKTAALAALADGSAQMAVGTHALFQDQVAFHNLGLAVIDEQHRFGVDQRLKLRQKGDEPHQIMMSATPIPRTLSMSFFADLDVSVIDELPPGRTPIVTRALPNDRREEVLHRMRAACLKGRQAYWVCPLIEESEKLDLQAAMMTFQDLCEQFPDLRVGLVHGRMKAAEKAAVMEAFKRGELHVLVATTVIEVGVDVPNASMMIIEHAERMGLSQLHQLRGRVGRGAAASACVLLYETPLSEAGQERLKIMVESTDGFEIARRDLEMRGPGEFLGARQSGAPMLKVADINRDLDLLEAAIDAAKQLASRPDIIAKHLDRWLPQGDKYLKV